MNRQSKLLQIVSTLSAPRRLPRLLNRRQQQGDQNSYNRDDDQ
jgi:hypothetical protein